MGDLAAYLIRRGSVHGDGIMEATLLRIYEVENAHMYKVQEWKATADAIAQDAST